MIFETPRLIVRLPNWADADVYFTLNSDPAVVRFIRPPRTRQEADDKLKELIANNKTNANGLQGWMVKTKSIDNAIGFLGLFQLPGSDEVNLGYSLLQPYWGLGYATEMANAAIGYAFNVLHLKSLVATTHADNLASKKILLTCGFKLIASFIEEGVPIHKFELMHTFIHDNIR